jgi:glycosyltransferase involved in cell wall biosynthesis
MRGLISEIGYDIYEIQYTQPVRKRGITKNNFYSLYDMAMLGITNHSKVPLRMAALIGFGLAIISLFFAFVYTIYKLVYWDNFQVGIAPLVIGLFFFSSVQLFFIGVIGEYVGSIQTQVMKRPLVIERERVNFNEKQN